MRETHTVQVSYEYHILNVELTNASYPHFQKNLTPEQLEMFRVYWKQRQQAVTFRRRFPDTSASWRI